MAGRKLNIDKFKRSWLLMADGKSERQVPASVHAARQIKRLQAGGWALDHVIELVEAGEAVKRLPDSPTPIIQPVKVTRTVSGENLLTARLRAVQSLLDQSRTKRELASALAEKVKPALEMRRKEVQEDVACPSCGETIKVTTVVLHPLKANLSNLMAVMDGAAKDEWTALGLPYGGKQAEHHQAMWVPRTTLDDLRAVIAQSLEQVVLDGTISAEQGRQIWERFKRGAMRVA